MTLFASKIRHGTHIQYAAASSLLYFPSGLTTSSIYLAMKEPYSPRVSPCLNIKLGS